MQSFVHSLVCSLLHLSIHSPADKIQGKKTEKNAAYFEFLLYLDGGETVVELLHESNDFKLIKNPDSIYICTVKHLL